MQQNESSQTDAKQIPRIHISENGGEWKVKPTNEKKKKLKKKLCEYLKRGKAIARPLVVTIKRVNEIVRGWINYFRIGLMKQFVEELGQWLRHK